ncbi:ATP-binding protein [Alkalitalea saponilacus]|uniref:Uncharacterized protein n=1 Tax=Alkalitalea saponilacus TaxID=889453 RepID=A0A1T5HTG7_9BACT|nr:ATP-binding protein [Alkalitalea saponilacus]ASB47668.1 hypothetical protein CDL62_00120 [Alkalitalea saponilacus]SKC23811.1 hypothetical protein SAMN03080601_03096 [Alkalitalea saponilacus]
MGFKNKIVAEAYSSYISAVWPVVKSFVDSETDRREKIVGEYFKWYSHLKKELKASNDGAKYVELQRNFRSEIFKMLQEHLKTSTNTGIHKLPHLFDNEFQGWIKDIPKRVTAREPYTWYELSRLKNPFRYPAAIFQNFRASLLQSFRKVWNGFRKLFRKPPKDITVYRVRRIPFNQILSYHTYGRLHQKQIEFLDELLTQYTKVFLELWEQDMFLDKHCKSTLGKSEDDISLNFEDKWPEIRKATRRKDLLQEFEIAVEKNIKNVFLQVDELYNLSDTLYLPNGKYKTRVVDAYCNRIHGHCNGILQGWNRSWLTLLDDWTLDVEISLLYLSVFHEYYEFEKVTHDYIHGELEEGYAAVEQFINQSRERFEKCEGQKKSVLQLVAKERKLAASEFVDKHITHLTEKLAICFKSDYRQLLLKFKAEINKVSEKRTFVSERKYACPVQENDVNSISPRGLLSFEALPVFVADAEKIMAMVEQNLEEARIKLTGLGSVWDFSLESAAMMLNETKGTACEAIISAKEGTVRALELLSESQAIVENTGKAISSDFGVTINRFNDQIQKLTNSESIFELNLKIARIKTLERSKEFRKKVVNGFKTAIPVATEFVKSNYKKIKSGTDKLQYRIGLKHESVGLAFELYEFINDTSEGLRKLPFVYQRLYQLTPVSEARFFVGREEELNTLTEALNNWRKDRFITIAVVGEKGSGVTSLLNRFLNEKIQEKDIYRVTLSEKIHTTNRYFDFFTELFGVEERFESNEQIIDYLINKDSQSVVVIENLHHFYLKKVNGFDDLMLLFDLMSNTMKKVLWIGAFTKHAWRYLDKTIHVSGYFTSIVHLQDMQPDVMEEIISRRNNISGYRLHFDDDEDIIYQKRYKNSDEKAQQEMLRKNFFRKLTRLSYGNISLAQLYWLRLTRKVTEREIKMGNVKEIDFSFVKDLGADELFVLQTIVLHDGLSTQDYIQITGKSENSARNILVPMLEKGLLIRPKTKYNVNPIVFSPVVRHLQSRNFIG